LLAQKVNKKGSEKSKFEFALYPQPSWGRSTRVTEAYCI